MPWGPASLRKFPRAQALLGAGVAGSGFTDIGLTGPGWAVCLGRTHRSQPRAPPPSSGWCRVWVELGRPSGLRGRVGLLWPPVVSVFPPPAPRQEITPSAGTGARDRFQSSWRVFLHIWSCVPSGPRGPRVRPQLLAARLHLQALGMSLRGEHCSRCAW